MRVVYDGEIHVHYGFLYLESGEDSVHELVAARGGQRNGLCGAAVPGILAMVTGLHTGEVPVRVEYHDVAPGEPEACWEDVVEVSIDLQGEGGLSAFDTFDRLDLPERGPHRARWCSSGMDAAHDMDTPDEGEVAPDRYLLQLWPATDLRPDEVVRVGSAYAAYWHGVAAETDPPPPPPTPEELAQQERLAREAEERAEREQELAHEVWRWGGRLPSEKLQTWGAHVPQLARLDRDLLDEIAGLTPAQQRGLTVWAVRRAFERAGLQTRPWAVEVLDLLARGEPVPQRWHDWTAMWDLVSDRRPGDEVETRVTISFARTPRPSRPPIDPGAAAIATVQGAADPHPGRAAAGAVDGLSSGAPDAAACFAEVRAALRTLP